MEGAVQEGDEVAEGDTLVILESMKAEIPVLALKDPVGDLLLRTFAE